MANLPKAPVGRLASNEDVARGLAALLSLDPRLVSVAARAGPVRLRQLQPNFNGLVNIIISQQVSTASAAAIQARFATAFPDATHHEIARTGLEILRAAGLSLPKARAIRAAATALSEGLDLAALVDLPVDEAMARLTVIKGVGPWTAEIFLLFGLGHADVIPAGDLALQVAVSHAFDLPKRLDDAGLRTMAADWSPWRGIAAKLFWAYHHENKL